MRDNKNRQSIDDFYREKINNGKLDFEANGWEAMNARLDRDAATSGVIAKLIASWKAKWIPALFILLIASSAIGFYLYNSHSASRQQEVNILSQNYNQKTTNSSNENTFEKDNNDAVQNADSETIIQNETNIESQALNERLANEDETTANTAKTDFGTPTTKNSKSSLGEYDQNEDAQKSVEASKSNQVPVEFAPAETTSFEETKMSEPGKNISGATSNNQSDKESKNPNFGNADQNSISKSFTEDRSIESKNTYEEVSSQKGSMAVGSLNSIVLQDKVEKEPLKFPFLPTLQLLPLSNSKEYKLDIQPIEEVKINKPSFKNFFVRGGYAVTSLNDDFNDTSPRFMGSIGYTFPPTPKGNFGLELMYERFRNTKKTAVFIEDLNVSSTRNRDAVSLMASATYKPFKGRFSTTGYAGFGLENKSWDLESMLFFPFSSVLAEQNSNRIYMKTSPFASIGGDVGFDIIKNRLSFHAGVFYQLALSDPTVNGTLQGYKINASENQEAYTIVEDRILRKENFTTLYISLKYYIF